MKVMNFVESLRDNSDKSIFEYRTPSYVCTVKSTDDDRIKRIREEVKEFNKANPGAHLRISFRGRLGKNNPNRDKYRTPAGRIETHTIKMQDAQRIDVYIHEQIRYRF